VRELTKLFFVDKLGYEENEIQFVDRANFLKTEANFHIANFSHEEYKKLNESARQMFNDRNHGLAKQVLNIALCEC
jgi:hypothetical protein